ncbi:MAG: hypothetical protein M0030_02420 [Actinomycetota bacterium]|nr:hypothetical protein [Actinomycetota bacterium]
MVQSEWRGNGGITPVPARAERRLAGTPRRQRAMAGLVRAALYGRGWYGQGWYGQGWYGQG